MAWPLVRGCQPPQVCQSAGCRIPPHPLWSFWGVRCCWGYLPRVLPLSLGDAGSDRLNVLLAETLRRVIIFQKLIMHKILSSACSKGRAGRAGPHRRAPALPRKGGMDLGSHRLAAIRVTVEPDKQHQQMLNPQAKVLGSRLRDSLLRSLNYKGERHLHSGERWQTPLTQVAGRGTTSAGQAAVACPPCAALGGTQHPDTVSLPKRLPRPHREEVAGQTRVWGVPQDACGLQH